MHETRRLAEWVTGTGYADLPSTIIDAIKRYVLDDLASGFAGAHTEWAAMVVELGREFSSGPCSLFARSLTLSPSYATLANGVMVGGFECDHTFTQGSAHPSTGVFPAVLAIGEREHLGGRAFLTAMTLGYESLCRVGAAATRAVEDERGFHGPGTNAAFGAAAGVGKALGFSTDVLTNAFGIAGSHGGGLLEFFREGAMTKRLHIGRGSQLGLESALLAARGFTGPSTVLEGSRGFLQAYSPDPHPERLLDGLGERYLCLEIPLKGYPCHISFQPVVDALQKFRREGRYESPRQIESVRLVGTGRMLEDRFTDRHPTTLMGAQYSLTWSAALALCRDVSLPTSWSEDDLTDPEVIRLADLMELVEAPSSPGWPFGAVAEVTISVAGAAHRLLATDWKGAPTNPCTYDDVATKCARYAAPYLSRPLVDQLVERVAALEREPDVAAVIATIRAPA